MFQLDERSIRVVQIPIALGGRQTGSKKTLPPVRSLLE
jgi:hypothetical protein